MTMKDIRETCEAFLADWDRSEWMQLHGDWESEEWDERRTRYDDARAELIEAVEDLLSRVRTLPTSDRADSDEARSATEQLHEITDEATELEEAAIDLEGQVTAEHDVIAEGTIDPDAISASAESLDIDAQWNEWDCREGWSAYRSGDALYLRWWRTPYPRTERHERDLWVVVDPEFFAEEAQ